MTPPPDGPEYLTTAQVAAELGIHEHTVRKYFRDGALPGRQIGRSWRTTRAALNAFVEGASSAPAAPIETPTIALEHKETP